MTPEELKALIAEAREWDSQIAQSAPTTTARLIELLADALEAVYDAGRRELAERFAHQDRTRSGAVDELVAMEEATLSAHPAEETEWEYAEFDPAEIQEDGTIHEWAEPKDTWDKPLPADELAELRAEGRVYARRRKPSPWSPIPADGG